MVKSSATSPYDSHLAVIAVLRLIRHGDVLFGSMQYSEGEVNETQSLFVKRMIGSQAYSAFGLLARLRSSAAPHATAIASITASGQV